MFWFFICSTHIFLKSLNFPAKQLAFVWVSLFRGGEVTFPRHVMGAFTITFLQWNSLLCAYIGEAHLFTRKYWLKSNIHRPSVVTSKIPARNPVLEAVGWQQCLSGMTVLWRSCFYHILNRAGWEGQINECFSYLLVHL